MDRSCRRGFRPRNPVSVPEVMPDDDVCGRCLDYESAAAWLHELRCLEHDIAVEDELRLDPDDLPF
jgi:hypothetical protein